MWLAFLFLSDLLNSRSFKFDETEKTTILNNAVNSKYFYGYFAAIPKLYKCFTQLTTDEIQGNIHL